MSEPTGEATQVVNADTASDDEISTALGLGENATEEPDGQEPKDTEFTELPEKWQSEINRLRRENAAQRVKARQAKTAEKPAAETEKVDVEKIRAEARAEARLENGTKLAASEIRGQLADVLPKDSVDDLIEDLNLSKYVDDDGDVDTDAVAALRDKYKTLLDGRRRAVKPSTAPRTSATAKTPQQELADALGLNT